ncbi:hypothetical protein FB451DRAFT_1506517 [Mycena latifolia]|nr:hypothetical protein FB451DRAFT_1506517 [Mycena latifolia]
MSSSRAALVVVQAIFNKLAYTPPNATPRKGTYHKDLAPLLLRIHEVILHLCIGFEIAFYLASLPQLSALSPYITRVSLASHPSIRTTPLFVIGVIAVVIGSSIRLSCFRALGQFFTFDLTIHPRHRLVTTGPYRYARHPAYTGSLTAIAGLALSHLSPGSWLWECGPLHRAPASAVAIGAVWWLYTLSMGLKRAPLEDAQMRALFPKEWDMYAKAVPRWFIPGII